MTLTDHRRGSASAAEPPGCSSPSLSLLDAMAAAQLLLLAIERLRFSTRPDELAPPARARFFGARCNSQKKTSRSSISYVPVHVPPPVTCTVFSEPLSPVPHPISKV